MTAEGEDTKFDFSVITKARERSMGRLMWRLKRYWDGVVEAQLEKLGFTDFKLSFLALLTHIDEQGTTNSELARRACVTKQAMSKMATVLEQDGYIQTRKHEKDSRSSIIFLTERGQNLLVAIFSAMREVRRQFHEVAGEQRMEDMIDTMLLLVKHLDEVESRANDE
ncbi:MarR family winged helix-turn-helix transcriptional regulator [Tellurirhabdus rosea]|uniref:MarR family winged helix-turn-helix transcriptional regulator n=1 Tax=Tellurirhabdus rosea TaxID=2674997 RepID=UPI0022521B0B|nr:MarR family transcriptional regulator [Tellurirhabdus rosea]